MAAGCAQTGGGMPGSLGRMRSSANWKRPLGDTSRTTSGKYELEYGANT